MPAAPLEESRILRRSAMGNRVLRLEKKKTEKQFDNVTDHQPMKMISTENRKLTFYFNH